MGTQGTRCVSPAVLRTPKQKPSRKWAASQLAPVKQGKFLEKTPPFPHLIKHTRNICVHQASDPRFIPLFPPQENSQGDRPTGSSRQSATPLSSMDSNYLTLTFSWTLLLPASGGHPCVEQLSFFLQDGTILQERNQQLKTQSIPAHCSTLYTWSPWKRLPSILTISWLGLFSLGWSASSSDLLLHRLMRMSVSGWEERRRVRKLWKVRIFLPGTLPPLPKTSYPGVSTFPPGILLYLLWGLPRLLLLPPQLLNMPAPSG